MAPQTPAGPHSRVHGSQAEGGRCLLQSLSSRHGFHVGRAFALPSHIRELGVWLDAFSSSKYDAIW